MRLPKMQHSNSLNPAVLQRVTRSQRQSRQRESLLILRQKRELTAVEFTPEGGNIVARAMAPASVSAKVEHTHKRFGEF